MFLGFVEGVLMFFRLNVRLKVLVFRLFQAQIILKNSDFRFVEAVLRVLGLSGRFKALRVRGFWLTA